ncbi:MAG: ATP-dependent endonuclease [Vampirovibrionales bacterium]
MAVYQSQCIPWQSLLQATQGLHTSLHPLVQRLWYQFEQVQTLPPWASLSPQQQVLHLEHLTDCTGINPSSSQPTSHSVSLKPPRCRPIHQLVLVEGTSELVFLPVLASLIAQQTHSSLRSNHSSIQWQPVGGKSLMPKRYAELAHFLACPIHTLLDADGQAEWHQLQHIANKRHYTHHTHTLLSVGTLEDTLSDELIAQTINHYYEPITPLTPHSIATSRFQNGQPIDTLTMLTHLFLDWELTSPRKHWGFDKVDFMWHIAQWLSQQPLNSSLAYCPPALKQWLTPFVT